MSKQSEAVITWRNRTKQRMIDAMGGKCVECGYTGCPATFDFHHIDPSTKEFGMGGMRANPVAWSRICKELKKCVILCANCHREVEAGYRTLKSNISTFNPAYEVYDGISNRTKPREFDRTILCVECKTELPAYTTRHKYCSDVCKTIAARRNAVKKDRPRKTAWPDKDTLHHDIQSMTWVAIGKKYGVSDNAVRKWAKSYKLL